jgi:hypothetical protein
MDHPLRVSRIAPVLNLSLSYEMDEMVFCDVVRRDSDAASNQTDRR